MAGHSKWANIKHKKAATDAKRGKIFTRLIREITVAAKLGGADASTNPRLRLAIDKALDNNMPKDTIERAAKRGAGELEGVSYEQVRYEGYGINGAAVIVDCLTDNKVRTVAEVRHAFSKYGGNIGTDGSVCVHVQALRAVRVRAGHRFRQADGGGARCRRRGRRRPRRRLHRGHHRADDFVAVKDALAKAAKLKPEFAEVTMKPATEVALAGDDAGRMQKLLDAIESLDDVQEVYTNAVIERRRDDRAAHPGHRSRICG